MGGAWAMGMTQVDGRLCLSFLSVVDDFVHDKISGKFALTEMVISRLTICAIT
jgi:hypothetical protein